MGLGAKCGEEGGKRRQGMTVYMKIKQLLCTEQMFAQEWVWSEEKERESACECVYWTFICFFLPRSTVPPPHPPTSPFSYSFILTFISQTLESKQTENNSRSENKVLGKIWLCQASVRIFNAKAPFNDPRKLFVNTVNVFFTGSVFSLSPKSEPPMNVEQLRRISSSYLWHQN